VAAAIKANRIEYVVNLSSTGAHLPAGNGPVNGLHDIEQKINEVATHVTHLRPTAFFENLLNSLATIKEAGAIFLPTDGNAEVPMIATKDIGDIASSVLLSLDWSGQRALHLWGPKEYTHNEVSEAMTAILERPVAFVEVSNDQARGAMTGMGITEDMANLYVELYNAFASGHFFTAIGGAHIRGATTFEEWARTILRTAYSA
jgi:uncharacterized protein YbjT (DUF2867 family)